MLSSLGMLIKSVPSVGVTSITLNVNKLYLSRIVSVIIVRLSVVKTHVLICIKLLSTCMNHFDKIFLNTIKSIIRYYIISG